MDGRNSYFGNLTNEIPGFTKNFGISSIVDEEETGLPMGYITADGAPGIYNVAASVVVTEEFVAANVGPSSLTCA